MPDYQYINNAELLDAAIRQLSAAPVLAMDTEFMREKTYYAQLCLIQVASDEHIYLFDPLLLPDISPLLDLLYNQNILKVLHAARQDLELFFDLKQTIPAPVFDTQIAATLLGFADQTGYANLVEKLLGVKLDKSHARTDWAQRPLSPQQLAYAADDVRYLIQLYPRITAALAEQGRDDWLTEDFAALTEASLYRVHPEQCWQRVSGSGRLKSAQLVILQQLAAWREQRAMQLNKPRKWILSDDALLQLAQRPPSDLSQLKKVRGLHDSVINEMGQHILDLISRARAVPREQWPTARPHLPPSRDQELLIDSLLLAVKYLALRNQISPSILAARKDIERLVRGETELAILNGWRRHIAGNTLLEILQGEAVMTIRNGKLAITTTRSS